MGGANLMKKNILKAIGFVLIFISLSTLVIKIKTYEDPPSIGLNVVITKNVM
jgi:hypothetical protein